MNLTHLRYFIEIYDTQSITIASKNLFVTQPTLSLALKSFEKSLDTSLFNRSSNEYLLTEQGEIVYHQGKSILQKVDFLNESLEQSKQHTKQETIRLGMTTLFSIQFMNEISKFMTLYTHVKLSIVQDGSHQLQQLLLNNSLDVALVSLPNYHPEKVTIEPLDTLVKGYHVYVVLPEMNPLSQRESLAFTDLKNEKFSSLTQDFVIGRMLLERTKECGYEANLIATHNDVQILLHSLIQTNSLCLLPIEYKQFFDFKHLKWVPLDDKFNYYPIGIGTSKEKAVSENVAGFIDVIRQC